MSFNSLFGLGNSSEDANILAVLPFQETTGTTADDISTNAYDGTIVGMGANPTTATGPNSYLTSAFDFEAGDDEVTLNSSSLVTGSSARTYGFWFSSDVNDTGILQPFLDVGNDTTTSGTQFLVFYEDDAISVSFAGHRIISPKSALSIGTWYLACIRVPSGATTTGDVDILLNGVDQTLTDESGASQTLNTTAPSTNVRSFGATYNSRFYNGKAALFFSFSRSLSDAECLEIYNGPEPECTVAPTVSGDTAQGSTLTAATGTWALPAPFASGSNGTLTYSYQWTRDGGDISGATSSTYVTQAADVGTAVGCKVLASNDGGSSSAEQTASSNTISVVSATSTYRMNMRLSISNSIGV